MGLIRREIACVLSDIGWPTQQPLHFPNSTLPTHPFVLRPHPPIWSLTNDTDCPITFQWMGSYLFNHWNGPSAPHQNHHLHTIPPASRVKIAIINGWWILIMQAPPSDRQMQRQILHHYHSNTNGHMGCKTTPSSPGMIVARKPELPPPTSPTNGSAIAPLPLPKTNVDPYRCLNETIVPIFKGLVLWNMGVGPGRTNNAGIIFYESRCYWQVHTWQSTPEQLMREKHQRTYLWMWT